MKASFLDHIVNVVVVVVLHSVQDHFLFSQITHNHSDVFFKDLAHPNPAPKNNKRHPGAREERDHLHWVHYTCGAPLVQAGIVFLCNIRELDPVQ
jgi:hypothetical protein